MKILAIDTSTSLASIALADDLAIVASVAIETGRKRGELMAAAAAALLERAGLAPADLDAYAVGLGPGSFTGLRTSLAFIKGLALAVPRPVAGVSTLHALAAAAADFSGRILPVMDARKGEVFAALFRSDGRGEVTRESADAAIRPEGLAELISGPGLILGPGLSRYREVIAERLDTKAEIAPEDRWYPRASKIAALALPRLQQGGADRVDTLVPVYVRASDAELSLGPRR